MGVAQLLCIGIILAIGGVNSSPFAKKVSKVVLISELALTQIFNLFSANIWILKFRFWLYYCYLNSFWQQKSWEKRILKFKFWRESVSAGFEISSTLDRIQMFICNVIWISESVSVLHLLQSNFDMWVRYVFGESSMALFYGLPGH